MYAALNVGTILPKYGYAACEHHNDARTCARMAAFSVGKYVRQVDKNLVTRKQKNSDIIILVANI